VLTRFLADRVGFVHAVEVDRRLEPHLAEIPKVELWWEDALGLDVSRLQPTPAKFVANLPYNIATPLIVETLDAEHIFVWCVMVQREVADRFFAAPRTKSYGAVSVLIQLAAVRTGFHAVSRDAFRPRPNVDSAVVAFRRTGPAASSAVRRVVDAGFAHRRKTLANSLALAGVAARERVVDALERLGHPPAVRAEALEPAEFVELAETLA
jgi:16S rRNA (adenine1518-N6/adenine1519-N6)-dimethyltransferase